jgi:Na+/H+-dicarboxylate symporter
MKKFIQNYKSTLILVLSVLVGTIIGLIFKEDANVLKPFGDIFLNLLLVSIVPLIFLTITTTLTKIKQVKRFQKIIIRIFILFIVTSLVAAFIGIFFTKFVPFVSSENVEILKDAEEATVENLNILERTAELITVDDFYLLLSKGNIVALLVFSVLIGISIRMTKEEGKIIVDFLEAANKVISNFIKLIMYYAPIGIGCYFASLVGTFGSEIAKGYLNTFLLYTFVALFTYFIIYSIYAYIAGGKKGIKTFWKNILPATFTAIGTCSSAASIPVNVEVSKKMGVKSEIAEAAIPLGTTFHKDGSIIGSVFKVMFLVYLFGLDVSLIQIIFVSLLATLLVTAVPIGGGTISEALILSLIGAPLTALPMLTIVATIIDPPATMLNVVGDSTVSMLTARWVDGKDWMKEV